MREIKFRIWDKSLKYMRYLSSSHDTIIFDEKRGHYYNLQNGDGNSFEDSGYSELMQNTGIKDKNGKEIYEGDVIECDGYLWLVEYQMSCYTIGFALNNIGHQESCVHHEVWDRGEVIGNIYENPELLEVIR